MKEPTWGVKAAYGRVTPHYGTLRSIIRFVSRFRWICPRFFSHVGWFDL